MIVLKSPKTATNGYLRNHQSTWSATANCYARGAIHTYSRTTSFESPTFPLSFSFTKTNTNTKAKMDDQTSQPSKPSRKNPSHNNQPSQLTKGEEFLLRKNLSSVKSIAKSDKARLREEILVLKEANQQKKITLANQQGKLLYLEHERQRLSTENSEMAKEQNQSAEVRKSLPPSLHTY